MMQERRRRSNALAATLWSIIDAVSTRFLPSSGPGDRPSSGCSSTIALSRSACSSSVVPHGLRAHLARRKGGEKLDFLISYKDFESARNPLQRFQLMQWLFHRFLLDHAEKPLALPTTCRLLAMQEWNEWSTLGRVQPGVPLPGLAAVATELRKQIAEDSSFESLAQSMRSLI